MQTIGWFSGGVTSAVAIKKAIESGNKVIIYYFETGLHHDDHARFITDCEAWYGEKINIVRNKKYKDVYDVLERGAINSPNGAYCTKFLKKDVRIMLERLIDYDAQVFGFEYDSKQLKRAERFTEQYPEAKAIYPLIDAKMTKEDCMKQLVEAGIELPMMYRLGYSNSNCIGCVKGGMGYWNKIRVDFPDHFKRMAEIERRVGATCLKEDGRTFNHSDKKDLRLFLDTLDPNRGRHENIALPECGVICPLEEY